MAKKGCGTPFGVIFALIVGAAADGRPQVAGNRFQRNKRPFFMERRNLSDTKRIFLAPDAQWLFR